MTNLRNGMKRTPMRRVKATERTEEGLLIAGKPWPSSWMSEKDWQSTVEDNAHFYGWVTWHCNMPMRSSAGWFDLALLGSGSALFVELKVRDRHGKAGRVSPHQWEYIAAAQKAGLDARVWTWPDDYDEMIAELSA